MCSKRLPYHLCRVFRYKVVDVEQVGPPVLVTRLHREGHALLTLQTDKQVNRQTDRKTDRKTDRSNGALGMRPLGIILSSLCEVFQKKKTNNRLAPPPPPSRNCATVDKTSGQINRQTRIHPTRMRTARLLTVSQVGWGVLGLEVCLPRYPSCGQSDRHM